MVTGFLSWFSFQWSAIPVFRIEGRRLLLIILLLRLWLRSRALTPKLTRRCVVHTHPLVTAIRHAIVVDTIRISALPPNFVGHITTVTPLLLTTLVLLLARGAPA
jgi:hypothetical protein